MKIRNTLSGAFLKSCNLVLLQCMLVIFVLNFYPSRIHAQDETLEIEWATYFGGTGEDWINVMVLDSAENTYLSFVAESGGVITTAGVHQQVYGGGSDAVIAKFDNEGKLIWSTYFGGSGDDIIYGMAITRDGNIAVGGHTTSSGSIATPGAENSQNKGGGDAFIALFNNEGQLIWATYLGGFGYDDIYSCAIGMDNSIFVAGYTSSTSSIASPESMQPAYGGGSYDGFISSLDSEGKLNWSTYLGGGGTDFVSNIKTDGKGNLYAAGTSFSNSGISTPGTHKPNYGASGDGMMVKMTEDGQIIWGTYYGDLGRDDINTIVVDTTLGFVYIMGPTQSAGGIATPGTFDNLYNGGTDLFVAKLTEDGQRLWGTYFGGNNQETAFGLEVNSAGEIYVNGMTKSLSQIASDNAYKEDYGGGFFDGFLLKLNPDGNRIWSTYFGGSGNDRGIDLKLTNDGGFLACFSSDSPDLATEGSHQMSSNGLSDIILSKWNENNSVDINELADILPLAIYPNPSSQFVHLGNETRLIKTISIFNTQGKLVLKYANVEYTKFDISSLPAGSFIVLLESGSEKWKGQFVKMD